MATPATAHTFGKYSLVAKLAVGGMAEIFLARLQGAAGFEKLVCIKRILPHLAKDQQLVNMFLAEARIAAQISHPNVCQVFELGEIGGRYFIAMEYLEGVPLSGFRRRDMYPHHPDPRMVAGFGVQACEGLHHAHQLKRPDGSPLEVVHRDVSSSNLFATVDGVVKVLDFGIAKVQDASVRTSTGSVKGTYAYMAPEQLRGERLDRRTDVFAMGIVLWEQFARQHLFKRDTEFLTFQAITTDEIPDVRELAPHVPKEVAQVITRALSRDREQRFPTARALGEALSKAVAPLGPWQPSQIGEEVARAFGARLEDQRELIRVAREGGVLDLDDPLGPAIGHGTELVTTPISMLSNVGAPVGVPRPSGVVTTPPRRSPVSFTIVLLAAIAAVIAGYYVWLQMPTKDAPAATPEPPKVVLLVDAAAPVVVDAAEPVAVIVDAAEPAQVLDAAEEKTAPVDAAVTTKHDIKPPRPPPPPPPPKQSGPPGTITIDSSPVYAVIFIDGKRYGETPLVGISLPPGKHSVRAVSASGTSQSLTINIESGKTAPTRRIEW
jgi:eukaryotic-like serine/threonine-protein kinase